MKEQPDSRSEYHSQNITLTSISTGTGASLSPRVAIMIAASCPKCTIQEEVQLQHTYWAPTVSSQIMPSIPTGTKKTLQELSRVFNKLASELTTELSHARNEIENLRKEIHRLKSSPSSGRTGHSSKSSKSSGKTTVRTHTGSRNSSHEKKNQGTLPKSDSEYIFPREPFNPPAPSEPSPPSNN
jgi:hypothetical protein